MNDVRRLVVRAEQNARPPDGDGERFSGYGVFSAPFDSGHLLAMRRFSASSLGPSYTSVWHRSPERPWTIWSDRPPLLACPRYFGSALETAALTEISVEWNGPSGFTVAVPRASLTWTVRLNTTPASWMMNAMAALMPGSLWRDERVLRSMGSMAATFLRAGNVGLLGTVPNGQRFHSKPMRVWVIGHTLALSRFDIAADAPVSATWPSGPAYGSDRERLAG